MTNPIRPTDDAARQLARDLMQTARFAALGFLTANATPMVTRIAFGLCPHGHPISLVSQLSAHTQALSQSPACSLLVGEPEAKGDPLTHPRLTLQARATFLARNAREHEEMAAHYLRNHPKSKLYIGFADFIFVRFQILSGHLNGGFGKAFALTAQDLGQDS